MSQSSTAGVLEWKQIATTSSEAPTLPRSGHAAVALPDDHPYDVLMFGGYTETPGDKQRAATNELWALSLVKGGWERIQPRGEAEPEPRIACQLVVLGATAYLIGGWNPGNSEAPFLSDVWALDLGTYTWSQVQVQGEQLQPISRFQAVALGGKVYLHTHRTQDHLLVLEPHPAGSSAAANSGGAGRGGRPPVAATLSRMPVATPQGAPPSRGLHSLTVVGGWLYLFGGAPQHGPMMGDLWRLGPLPLGDASGGGGGHTESEPGSGDTESEPRSAEASGGGSGGEGGPAAGVGVAWEALHAGGKAPAARCSHVAVALGGTLYFHGGAYYRDGSGGGLVGMDDFFCLDTRGDTLEWRWPQVGSSASSPRPSARNAATMVAIGTPYPTAAGDNGCAENPSGDGGGGGKGRGLLVLHGGWRAFVETYGDTFVMQVPE